MGSIQNLKPIRLLKTYKSKIGKQVEFEDEVLDEDGRRRSFGRTGKESEV